jgi:hypothetical protein
LWQPQLRRLLLPLLMPLWARTLHHEQWNRLLHHLKQQQGAQLRLMPRWWQQQGLWLLQVWRQQQGWGLLQVWKQQQVWGWRVW